MVSVVSGGGHSVAPSGGGRAERLAPARTAGRVVLRVKRAFWPFWQQMLLNAAPWLAQLKKFVRQACRFATTAPVSTGWNGCRRAWTADIHASTSSRLSNTPGVWARGNRMVRSMLTSELERALG